MPISRNTDSAQDDLPLPSRRPTPNEVRPTVEDDRELTLSTGTLLALFIGLALICAVFFGFGYSMGRKGASTTTADASSDAAPVSGSFNNFKPAPGSPAIQGLAYKPTAPAATEPVKKQDTPAYEPTASAAPSRASAAERETTVAETPAAPIVRTTPAPVTVAPAPVAVPVASTASAVTQITYVQVAAVSHQEDADVLLSALKRRGYAVQVRSQAGDSLLHVQIGPFNNRKDAEAMRQKLQGDGYNAFLK